MSHMVLRNNDSEPRTTDVWGLQSDINRLFDAFMEDHGVRRVEIDEVLVCFQKLGDVARVDFGIVADHELVEAQNGNGDHGSPP